MTKLPLRLILTALAAALPFTGCSKHSDRMSVVSTTPAANSSGLAPDTSVSVVFSASVREETLTPSNFGVRGSTSGTVAGPITYDDPSRTATFKPSAAFKDGELVTVDLSSSIQGKSGAGLRGRTFTFEIRPPEEPEPPPPPPPPPPAAEVTSRDPAPGSCGVARDAPIHVEFSLPMDPLTFTSDTVRVDGNLGGRIEVQLSEIVAGGNRLTILPHREFLPYEWITVRLGAALKTAAGGSFAGETFGFRALTAAPAAARWPGPDASATAPVRVVEPGDLDGDGRLDLVLPILGVPTVELLRGLAGGAFESAGTLDTLHQPFSIHLADLNDDGRLDLLVGENDRVAVFLNQGPGIAFARVQVFGTGTAVRSIVTGDLDHRGTPDVVLDTDRGLRVHLNGLSAAPVLTVGTEQVARTRLLLRDLDEDGELDLIYGDSSGDRLSIHRGGGPAGFLSRETLALPGRPLWVAAENLDQEGGIEVIVGSASASGSQIGILSIPDDPGAAPAAPGLEPLPEGAERTYSIADLDGDGLSDLLAADLEAAGVFLFRNTGGAFDLDAPVQLIRDHPARSALAVDITGDGVLDLITVNGRDFKTLLSEGGEEPPPPPPPPDVRLAADSLEARPGDADRKAVVRLKSNVTVEAFTVVLAFNPAVAEMTGVDLEGTAAAAVLPEFVSPMIRNEEGFAAMAVVVDFLPPFDGRALPAGDDLPLVNFRFQVPASAPAGSHPLELKDGLGSPPLANTVVHAAAGIAPVVSNGLLEVIAIPPPPPPPDVRLAVDSLEARPGDADRKAVVRLKSNVTVEAFTVVLAFDPAVAEMTGVDLEGTAAAPVLPEFISPVIKNEEGFAAMGVVIDFLPPFDGRSLPPGDDLPLVNFRFQVPDSAPAGSHALELKDGLGSPPLANTVVHAAAGIAPVVSNGLLEVIAPPPPNPNRIRIDRVEVPAGTEGRVPVFLTTVEPVDAFSVVAQYDPQATPVTRFDLAGSITGSLSPEFVVPSIRSAESYFAYTVIFDFTPPFDQQHIPPGEDHLLFHIVFDVPAEASLGEHLFRLRNDLGDPPLANSLASGGESLYPDLFDGVVNVVAAPPPPPAPRFIRGDANGSGKVDISDYVFLLTYLFNSGTPPKCLDAADVDDNARLNGTDAVWLVDYIFRGVPVPRPPFPQAGEDPTPDDLECLHGI